MMRKVDATQGKLPKQIIIYTIPLILTTVLQNLFDIADKAVLGNIAGTVAVASIIHFLYCARFNLAFFVLRCIIKVYN